MASNRSNYGEGISIKVFYENKFFRSYDLPPPGFEPNDPKNPINDRRYNSIAKDALPMTECLKDTVARVIPYWHDHIAADILQGKSVLVVAHGNSIRAIVKYLDNVSEKGFLFFPRYWIFIIKRYFRD